MSQQVYNCSTHGKTVHVHESGLVCPDRGPLDPKLVCDRCGEIVKEVKGETRKPRDVVSIKEMIEQHEG